MTDQKMHTELDPAVYGAWFRSELGQRVWKDERRALGQSLGEVAGRSVLDVGAGEGRLARELSSQGARVVALDRSEAMLRAGEYSGEGPHPKPVRGDAMELPFADESFDVVVAVTVLCFIEREADMAHELARVTKAGGRVVLGELGRWSTWALARRVGAWLKGGLWSAARFRTASELREILSGAGLQPGDVHGAVFYPRSVLATRQFGWADPRLGRKSTVGAAFLAVAGVKKSGDESKTGTRDRVPDESR